jgi:MFS family permease
LVITYVAFGLTGFLGMCYIIFVRLGPQKEERRAIFMALIGGIIALIGGIIAPIYRGVVTTTDFPPFTDKDSYMLILGLAIEILGWFFFRFFFLRIKDYDELEWKSGLEDLYIIMAETGIGVYACEFNRAATIQSSELSGEALSEKINSDLIAGGLIGIKAMLSEIAGTKKGVLEVLSLKDKNLICKQGNTILAVMKAKANLGVYHTLLRTLVDDIEETNKEALDKFKGDLRTLDIDTVVKKHFGKIVDNV